MATTARAFSDMGKTDVLLIVPDETGSNPLAVPRRPTPELSNAERVKLENQGVTKEHHTDDLSVMKARYALDKDCCVHEVERSSSAVLVKRRINALFSTTKNQSVILHFIGPGKSGTGDWCFNDSFITFRDIMTLHMINRRQEGRPTLFISSDCSYSGNWLKEAMNFLDEKGIGPCGHISKEKDILLTVQACCLSTEVPKEMAFSLHSIKNDKNTGCVMFSDLYRNKAIAENQHPSKINFFSIMCKSELDKPCTMAPGSTWKMWRTSERLCIIANSDNIQPKWNVVLLKDDEATICAILLDGSITDNLVDYVHVLKSGWGKEPPNEVQQWLQQNYKVDYEHTQNGSV